MTQEQIRILTNYMKVQGFAIQKIEPFDFAEAINETITDINTLERILIEKKEVKDRDKRELLLSQEILSAKKKDIYCVPKLLSCYVIIAKNRQELYNDSKKEYESLKSDLNYKKLELEELFIYKKEVKNVKIDFNCKAVRGVAEEGKDVRDEHFP